MRWRRRGWLATLAMVALILPACNGGGPTASSISLNEFAITASPSSGAAGTVTFEISNSGEQIHEFVVIRTDLGAGELPVGEDGSVVEDDEGLETIDEIDIVEPGSSETLEVELAAGSYVLICNILDVVDDEPTSHYELGMRTSFEVT